MKTTKQIYDQHRRISDAFWSRTTRRAAAACPSSGGNLMLCHNWASWGEQAECAPGATIADAIWKAAQQQSPRIRAIYTRLYDEAEHRTHGDHFRPLWCAHCKKPATVKGWDVVAV